MNKKLCWPAFVQRQKKPLNEFKIENLQGLIKGVLRKERK